MNEVEKIVFDTLKQANSLRPDQVAIDICLQYGVKDLLSSHLFQNIVSEMAKENQVAEEEFAMYRWQVAQNTIKQQADRAKLI